jgi:hypothetical protein
VPRTQAQGYPKHVEVDGIGIGAFLLKDADVKQRFATDLNREFLVVEVALYPPGGAQSVSVI